MDEPRLRTPSNGPGEWQYEGVVYLSRTTPSMLNSFQNWKVHPDDVIIAGYPKSGNGWTQIIVSAILRANRLDTFEKEAMVGLSKQALDLLTLDQVAKLTRPGIVYTHLQPGRLPTALSANQNKVIHLIRNPNDVAVSYYHFHRMCKDLGNYNGSWDDFFPYFIEGNIVYSSCHEHIKGWIKNSKKLNVKHIYYEDLISEPARMVRDLASFLNRSLDNQQVKQIVWKTCFQKMKEYSHLLVDPTLKEDISPYLRRGVIGDWKNYFNEEQTRQAAEKHQELEKETGIKFQFE